MKCARRSFVFYLFLAATVLILSGPAHVIASPVGIIAMDDVTPALPWDSSTLGIIGNTGQGSMVVYGGGHLEALACGVGYEETGNGSLTIIGTGSTFDSYFSFFVGYHGTGTAEVNDGGILNTAIGYLGYEEDSSGTLRINGASSQLNIGNQLVVGNRGDGTLFITEGGVVTVAEDTIVADRSGSTGRIMFENNGGTLNTRSLTAAATELFGTGTINTKAFVGDYDVVFDTASGLQSTFVINSQPNQNITVHLDVSDSTAYENVPFVVGYQGSGSMVLQDGLALNVNSVSLGNCENSSGVATITGADTTLNAETGFYVGESGSGDLHITAGGTLTSREGHVGYQPDSGGTVTIDGVGSSWTNTEELTVAEHSTGTLLVSNGATLTCKDSTISGSLNTVGVVTIDGPGSTWTNSGLLNIGPNGQGTLNITGGATVNCVPSSSSYKLNSYIGETGYTGNRGGVVNVDGVGSTWTNSNHLHVGGVLNITNGGEVTVGKTTYVTYHNDTNGTIDFGPNGGTLNTKGFQAAAADLIGTGTINTNGVLSDVDLVFDAVGGATTSIVLDKLPGQNVTLNVDMSSPENPQDLGVGFHGEGSLAIRDGVTVYSNLGYLGYEDGSKGTAIIDGPGSTWNHVENLYIGYYGDGVMEIVNGGLVAQADGFGTKHAYIGYGGDSTGRVTVRGIGSAWQEISQIQVGYYSHGYLSVLDGGVVSSSAYAHIGASKQSFGYVHIDGDGSQWTSGGIAIGDGLVEITNGGSLVTDGYRAYLGTMTSHTGVVTVDGIGSRWDMAWHSIYLGDSGDGVLNISGGGTVTTTGVRVKSGSLLAINVDDNSHIVMDGGNEQGALINDGTIRIMAGAQPSANAVYTPITANSWSGTGTFQALGGTWDAATHQFTVSHKALSLVGVITEIDLSERQRLFALDVSNGRLLDVSFDPTSVSTSGDSVISFIASCSDAPTRSALALLLDGDEVVLDAWDITTDLADGELALLSMRIESGWQDLTVWHYDGAEWTEYELPDHSNLCYDGTYASFLVSGFSGYAVTGTAVPEPNTVVLVFTALLGIGAFGASVQRKRK